MFGALRALESLSQMLRGRAVPPGSALEAVVPPEAVWPADDEGEGEGEMAAGGAAAGLPQVERRRRRRQPTVLLVEEVDIYDAPRFRYRWRAVPGCWLAGLPAGCGCQQLRATMQRRLGCQHPVLWRGALGMPAL